MTNDFLDHAEKQIMKVLKAAKPELMLAFGNTAYETKGDRTPVTILDTQLEEKLRAELRKIDSGIGIEGEELGQEGSRKTYWLVDPIDGTEQFIRGIPSCKNLLCLIDEGQPVWALMYFFTRDELWTARRGKGTYCNGQRVQMRYRPLEESWIELSVNLHMPENLQKLATMRHQIAGFSILRDFGYVVSGRVDGHLALNTGGGPWDYAPRSLLSIEAGAKIANIGSKSYDFNNNSFLIAHPDNFDQLMQSIN